MKKKRLLRRLIREQGRLLDEQERFTSDGVVSALEKRHLEKHAETIKKLVRKLVPREPLDWIGILVRSGVAVIIFILLMIVPFTYLRNTYLSPESSLSTSSSATGTASVRAYVPEIPASESSNRWMRRDVNGPIAFTHSKDFRGMTAGVVPHMRSGQKGIAIFWTEATNDKRILKKLVTDDFFRGTATEKSTVWEDQDFESAAAIAKEKAFIVAAAYRSAKGNHVAVDLFDLDGRSIAKRIELGIGSDEAIEDIQAMPWNDGWALTTRIPRTAESGLFDPTKVKVRVLDDALAIKETFELAMSGYELGPFPVVVPHPAGYGVIATAHPSIRSNKEPAGDRLFAFQFDAQKTLNRILRLTNVGGQHDYWTTGFARLENGEISIGVQNIPGYSFDDPEVTYPPDAGRAYLRFFDQAFQLAGTVIVFDDPAVLGQPDRQGAAHLRMTKIGNRMYVAYDMLNTESSETGVQDRSVQAMWIHIQR